MNFNEEQIKEIAISFLKNYNMNIMKKIYSFIQNYYSLK